MRTPDDKLVVTFPFSKQNEVLLFPRTAWKLGVVPVRGAGTPSVNNTTVWVRKNKVKYGHSRYHRFRPT